MNLLRQDLGLTFRRRYPANQKQYEELLRQAGRKCEACGMSATITGGREVAIRDPSGRLHVLRKDDKQYRMKLAVFRAALDLEGFRFVSAAKLEITGDQEGFGMCLCLRCALA